MTREELVQMREYQVGTASTQYWNKNKGNDDVSIITAFEDGVAWADEHLKNPWISVEERLPERTIDEVICKTLGGSTYLCFWDGCRWCSCHHDLIAGATVTHWMPIPKLKKRE